VATTVRCVAEKDRAEFAIRDAIDAGWLQGPRIFTAGQALVCTGGADGSPLVYPMASEAAARGFLDDWQASNLLHTRWDEMVVHIFLLDPGQGPQSAGTPAGGAVRAGQLYRHRGRQVRRGRPGRRARGCGVRR
jgi:hypothetical protein